MQHLLIGTYARRKSVFETWSILISDYTKRPFCVGIRRGPRPYYYDRNLTFQDQHHDSLLQCRFIECSTMPCRFIWKDLFVYNTNFQKKCWLRAN